jgi:ABC-2 type transport system permease protein
MISLMVHELRIRRRAILGWTIGLSFFAVLYMSFFPALPDDLLDLDFESIDVYKSMGVRTMSTFEGYMLSSVLNFLPLLVAAFGIVLGAGALAGEEGDGTLELLAALPISRFRLYSAKALSLMLTAFVITLAVAAITLVAFLALESELDTDVTAESLFGVMLSFWLVAFIFVSLSLFLGAYLPSRGSAVATASAILVAAFFGNNLAGMVSGLENLQPLSPFSYFSRIAESITGDVPWDDVAVLLAMGVVPLILGAISFQRRDLTVGAWPWQRAVVGATTDESVPVFRKRRVIVPVAALAIFVCGCWAVTAAAIWSSDDLRQEVEDTLGIGDEGVLHASGELSSVVVPVLSPSAGQVLSLSVESGQKATEDDVLAVLADQSWPDTVADAKRVVDEAWLFVAEYTSGVQRPSDTAASLAVEVLAATHDAQAAEDALNEAQANGVDEAQVQLLEAQTDIAAARARIAEARLALAEDRLTVEEVEDVGDAVKKIAPLTERDDGPDETSVLSSVPGTIGPVLVSQDELVSEGQPIALVTEADYLELLVSVSEDDADVIEVGQTVEIEVDDLDDPVEGEVVEVFKRLASGDDDADDDLAYTVRIRVENRSGDLEAGMEAEATIELE